MKTISTEAKDKNELHYLIHALFALGVTCPAYTAESFIQGGYRHVILYENGEIGGNYDAKGHNNYTHGKLLPVAEFIFEAAKRKFSPPKPSWKIGCRDVEVGKDGKSLYIPADDITIPKSTIEDMLKALA